MSGTIVKETKGIQRPINQVDRECECLYLIPKVFFPIIMITYIQIKRILYLLQIFALYSFESSVTLHEAKNKES